VVTVRVLLGGRRWGRSEGGGNPEVAPRKGLPMGEGMALRPEGGYEMIECGSIIFQGEEGLAQA
jgi:hypothetical protein